MNLVPSCFECNHAKLSQVPTISSEQTLHPYFDDWGGLEILQAAIRIETTVYAEFGINVDAIPEPVAERALLHFQTLDLATLYSEHASIELVQRRDTFVATFESDGPVALRRELVREFQSRLKPFPNAWQPVLYQALAGSSDFVNGGFYSIEQ
jgi:hypothetical protein